jgi:hypothetical protein
MANIPLANIPNAPQALGQSPMASPSAVRAQNLQTMPVLGREVFDGVGAGMAGLSRGIWEGGQFLNEFASKMSAANDDFQYAAADRAFSEAVANHEVEASTLPPDRHLEIWQNKYLPKVQDQIRAMKVSPAGRARLDAFMERQTGNSYAAIVVGANKQFLQAGLRESDNFIQRAVNEGRDEDALGQLARDVVNGIRSKEEAEAIEVKMVEERKVATMTSAIQQNPAQWRDELRQYQKTGKNPHGLRPEQVLQFRRMAESVHGQLLEDLTNEMLDRLETDSAAITNDQIEEFYKRPDVDAPRPLINKLKDTREFQYAQTPEGQAERSTRYSDLWQKIFNYDAEADISTANPEAHKRAYQQLVSDIVSTAPEGERKPFLDTLNGMVSQANQGRKSRADEIARGLVDLTGKLASWGQLGDDGGWQEVKRDGKTERVPKDPQRQFEVQTKRLEVTNDIRAMLRENPDLTEEQAMERFKGILENRLDGGALFMQQPDEEAWWKKLWDVASWANFAMNPTANNPNIMTAGLGFRGFGGSPVDGLVDADEPLPPVQGMPPAPASAPASFSVSNLPPAKQPIAGQIASMAEAEGLGQYTPHLMLLVAQESNFNPSTTISTSSARGLFQLLNADRKRYGSDSTVEGQIRAGLAKTKENITAARRALGRDPDPFELYVVHYQGIGAGPAILKNPDGNFRQTLDATGGKGHAARVMKANPWLVRDNIQTNQDFIDWVRKRLSKKAADLGMA